MNFISLLNHYIDKNGSSNNFIISHSGIDRSTFYKILKGSRYPTEKQLYSILDGLDIATSERKELIEMYEKEVLDDETLLERNFVTGVLELLSEYDDYSKENKLSINIDDDLFGNPAYDDKPKTIRGVGKVRDYLKTDIAREILYNKNELDIYVSLELLGKLGIYNILQLINSDKRSGVTPIKHLVEIPVDNIFIREGVVGSIKEYLNFLLSQNLNYEARYYKTNGNSSSQMGVLYPYYIITTDSVLLLSRDGTELLIMDEKEQIKSYKDSYQLLINNSEYLVSKISEKEKYVHLLDEREDKKLYIIEKRPGLSFIATNELIDKYVSAPYKEAIKKHIGCFVNHPYKEIISYDGLLELMKSNTIEEVGVRIEYSKEDCDVAFQVMKSRLHDTLEVLDPDKLSLSDNWSISVLENDYVILVPYLTNDKIIYVPEKNIAKAFTRFVEKLAAYNYCIDDLSIPVE